MLARMTLSLVAVVACAGGVAFAQPKAKVQRACGITALPLSVGNQWIYQATTTPTDKMLSDVAARMTPRQPKQVVIEVVSVEAKDGATLVTLSEESLYLPPPATSPNAPPAPPTGRKITTTITCGPNLFRVSPESFFFSGEGGGTYGLSIEHLERKGNTFDFKGGKLAGPTWSDDLVMKWKRIPTPETKPVLGQGTLEMERRFSTLEPGTIDTPSGTYKATQIAVEITGRVTLDPPAERNFELPANFRTHFWFAPEVGIVQVFNGYTHTYQLANSRIAK